MHISMINESGHHGENVTFSEMLGEAIDWYCDGCCQISADNNEWN